MEYWCSIQLATTAQGPSNPVGRDHMSALHWGAPSIFLMASWGLPGWWMAEQPDKDPPASFIFLVSKTHLFYLSSFQHNISSCPAEPRYEYAYWVFIAELRPWALWNSQEPFGRRALQVQALTEVVKQPKSRKTCARKWPGRKCTAVHHSPFITTGSSNGHQTLCRKLFSFQRSTEGDCICHYQTQETLVGIESVHILISLSCTMSICTA